MFLACRVLKSVDIINVKSINRATGRQEFERQLFARFNENVEVERLRSYPFVSPTGSETLTSAFLKEHSSILRCDRKYLGTSLSESELMKVVSDECECCDCCPLFVSNIVLLSKCVRECVFEMGQVDTV